MNTDLERAIEIYDGNHYCDVERDHLGQHPNRTCDCACSLCHSFWLHNVRRFEEARDLLDLNPANPLSHGAKE